MNNQQDVQVKGTGPFRPLDIADYVLRGEPSAKLQKYISGDQMFANTHYLNLVHQVMHQAEDQVLSFRRASPIGALPDTISVYNLAEVAGPLKQRPVQLATVIADTIIMAAGQLLTFDKRVRWQAILGISDAILVLSDQQKCSLDVASERVIRGFLEIIERRSVAPDNEWSAIDLHSRKLVLKQIADAP